MKASTVSNTSDIDEITTHYGDHISICKINWLNSEILRDDNFSFKNGFHERSQETSFEIKLKISFKYGPNPASILKQTIDVHLKHVTNTTNYSFKESTFPDELKQS